MDNLLSAYYTQKQVDAVLSPYDGLSIGIISALKGVGYGTADQPMPIISGQDAEIPSVKSIIAHEQYSTIFKDTRDLAKVAANMVDAVESGGKPEINDTKTYNNKVKIVPSYLLTPVTVDATNCQKALVDTGYYKADSSSNHWCVKALRASIAERGAAACCNCATEFAMSAILEMRGITKSFPGVKALRDVNLAVKEGEIHAICGENGAGKSTLMKVLSGVYPYGSYEGEIVFQGAGAPLRAHRRQRTSRHHHHPPGAGARAAAVDRREHLPRQRARHEWASSTGATAFNRTRELLAKVGLKESPNTLITNLGVGKQQLVEIAKALAKKVKLLDPRRADREPQRNRQRRAAETAARIQGAGHHLDPDFAQAQRAGQGRRPITVLRDGTTVETIDCHREKISEGPHHQEHGRARDVRPLSAARPQDRREDCSRSENWRVEHPLHAGREVIKGVNLHVNRGEVVGIAGLMGAGRTELAMSVFGRAYGRNITRPRLHGRQARSTSRPIQKAVATGIAYVTEDRKSLGLVLSEDIKNNVTLANLPGDRLARRDRRRTASTGSPTTTAACSRSAPPASSRRRSICRAAISRRSC